MATVGDEINEYVEKYKKADERWRQVLKAMAILEKFKWEQIREEIKKIDEAAG